MEQISLPDNNGFLSNKYSAIIENIKKTYYDWFSLIEQINSLIYDMYHNFDVKNNDMIGMYLVTSFSKVHKSFQTCSLLYSYGLEDDVHIILRTMLESFLISSSIKEDNNSFDKLLKNQEIEDIQKTNTLIDIGFIQNKKKQKINYKEKTSILKFAKQSKYKEMYYTAYSYLSSYIHIDLRTLEKNYIFENDTVSSICIAPSTDDLCFILTETIGLMLAYIELIKDYLIKDYNNELNNLKSVHIQLQKRNKKIK